jgi:hypothetical protein
LQQQAEQATLPVLEPEADAGALGPAEHAVMAFTAACRLLDMMNAMDMH